MNYPPANPFDFKTRLREDGTGMTPSEALLARAARYQTHRGIETLLLSDLLALLAEGLGFGGWPAEVMDTIADRHEGESFIGGGAKASQTNFKEFCALFVEMRRALDAAAECADESSAAAGGFMPLMAPLRPLLSLQGPVHPNLSDASFVNPLRHLARSDAPAAISPAGHTLAPDPKVFIYLEGN